jgi:hypothetical protein
MGRALWDLSARLASARDTLRVEPRSRIERKTA